MAGRKKALVSKQAKAVAYRAPALKLRLEGPWTLFEMTELARAHTPAAFATLHRVMTSSRNDQVRINAAQVLLDRAWGKPNGSDGVTVNLNNQVNTLTIPGLRERAAEAIAAAFRELPPPVEQEGVEPVASEITEPDDETIRQEWSKEMMRLVSSDDS